MMSQDFLVGYQRPDGSRWYGVITVKTPRDSKTTALEAARYSANQTAALCGHTVVVIKERKRDLITAL
ncbi:hypothetical protein VZG28_04905 [Synechococcus elongatus IITB4]|uniref:hypothetical protein n=1 Tax=Synechococcus elongatus TaxID=32046 RepID=UPI0030CD4557